MTSRHYPELLPEALRIAAEATDDATTSLLQELTVTVLESLVNQFFFFRDLQRLFQKRGWRVVFGPGDRI